jgi:predicted ATPase
MPLALEMAASWLRYLSCQDIAEQINRDKLVLMSTSRDVPSRHRSMKAVFNQSWRSLSDTEQRAMMQLSMFAGQFGAEAGLEVAGVGYETLFALVDKAMLNKAENARFGMDPLIRQYAAERLIEADLEVDEKVGRKAAAL